MQKFEIFHEEQWHPLKHLGLTNSFWSINSKTIIYTWIVLGFILIFCLTARFAIKRKYSIPGFLALSFVRTFNNLITNTLSRFYLNHFLFITSLFTFIFVCNIISLIPWIDEPTADPGTTLALGITSFFYVQISAIRAKGIIEYIKEYFSPFFLLFPLNVIGELAKVISISFRLFGNIFGGSIISRLWTSAISGSIIKEMLGIVTGINLLIVFFFVMFEGFIQAFVFSMLTLTYLSVAITDEEHGENHK